jgi:hypothetical protein
MLSLADGRPFDSTTAGQLAGIYDLRLVSDWEQEAGRWTHGRLDLWPTDTLHQFYELGVIGRGRHSGNRPLWGTAQLPAKKISIPLTADPAARDPDHPGVLLHSNGSLELGVWRGFDGSSTTLHIDRVGALGFAGTWDSDLGIMVLMGDGRRLPNPHGHFCAVRR